MAHNKTIFLGLFCFTMFICSVSSAQISNARVNYKVKLYYKDSAKKSRSLSLTLDEVGKLEFELAYNKDSIKEQAHFFELAKGVDFNFTQSLFKRRAKLLAGLNESYYYDIRHKSFLMEKNFLGSEYIVRGNHEKYNWEITEETKELNGYTCTKAITQTSYKTSKGMFTLHITAWFAPDLPIPVSLKDYLGLPGLILELHECADSIHDASTEYKKGRTYYVTEIELNKKEPVDVKELDSEGVLTEAEFQKIVEDNKLTRDSYPQGKP